MAHAAAHLKKAREFEQSVEYRALQKARERRRRQRERAERKRQVNVFMYASWSYFDISTTRALADLTVSVRPVCVCGVWVGCGACTDVDLVERAAVLSDDLKCNVREMDDGGIDDRCEISEGGRMLTLH